MSVVSCFKLNLYWAPSWESLRVKQSRQSEGVTVFFKGIPDCFSGYFSVCGRFMFSAVTWLLAAWLYLSGLLVLTLVWLRCLVTPQSLVADLNAVQSRESVDPPLPLPLPLLSLDSNSTSRPPGSWCVRHWPGHKDLQRMLPVNTAEPAALEPC